MSNKSVFDYQDYKRFLHDKTEVRRGDKLRLSKFIKCNAGYISQIFSGRAHLSLEQAERASRFLGLTEEESKFFLLLVQKCRAGTKELEAIFEKQIHQTLNLRTNLAHRLEFNQAISQEHQVLYYSSWHYIGVHMALSLPSLKTKEAIGKYLGISLKRVSEIIEFLLGVGLIEQIGDKYHTGKVSIHLESGSPLIYKHHTNWRLRAIDAVDSFDSNDLHYSSVVTIAKSDVPKMRELLVNAIEEIRTLVAVSKKNALYCYNFDLFSLEKGIS